MSVTPPSTPPVIRSFGGGVIPLTNTEEVAIIDDQDWELTAPFRWRLNKGDVATSVPHPEGGWVPRSDFPGGWRERVYFLRLSRLIMGLEYGNPLQVDHDNHDVLDNRRSNLVVVTTAENCQNLLSRRGSSSRYRGVSWDTRSSRWEARGKLNYKSHRLGYFKTEEEAARAVAEWRAANMPHSAEARAR